MKKGRYPGGPKPFIYSEKVVNGGASKYEVEALYRKENGPEKRTKSQRARHQSSRGSSADHGDKSEERGYRGGSQRRTVEMVSDGYAGAERRYVRPERGSERAKSFRGGGGVLSPHVG